MSPPSREDAQMTLPQASPGSQTATSETQEQVVQRWRQLREMMIQQLDMFESGGLTLHSNATDVSLSAIRDLKDSIREFDALILRDAPPVAGG
jgi:hypothetical protein